MVAHDANRGGAAYGRCMRQARLLGSDTEVPCADGRMRRYVNLDNAASTSAMVEVWEAVERFMPWYSSVHRGSGWKSQMATGAGGQPPLPGAVRASLGIGSTAADVDRLIAALTELAAYGPRARYERGRSATSTGRWQRPAPPQPDPR